MATITQARVRTDAALPLSWIALVTVWILWGSTYLGIRVAVETIPPLLMCGVRFLVAGCILASALAVAQRRRLTPLRLSDMRHVLLTAVLLLVVGTGTLSWSETRLPSGLAALIVAGVPIWMMLFDALFTRTIKPLAILGILVGTAGMIALVGFSSAGAPPAGALVLIGSSMSWAFGSVLARRRHSAQAAHPLSSALEMIVAGSVLCLAAALAGELHGFRIAAVSGASFAGFAWLVVMGSMVAYSAYGYAVRTLPTNIASTYAYVNPIVAVLLGALILHEAITRNIVVGGATVVLAVIIILFANTRKEA